MSGCGSAGEADDKDDLKGRPLRFSKLPVEPIGQFGFDSAASLQAVVPKGTFGQFQPNALPFESMHTLLMEIDPSLLVSSRRRPAVEISGEASGRVAWREAFGGIMAFTKWFEMIMPPADSRNIEHPRIHLADHIRVFPIRPSSDSIL